MSSQLGAPSCEKAKQFSAERAEGSRKSRRERRAKDRGEPRWRDLLRGGRMLKDELLDEAEELKTSLTGDK